MEKVLNYNLFYVMFIYFIKEDIMINTLGWTIWTATRWCTSMDLEVVTNKLEVLGPFFIKK